MNTREGNREARKEYIAPDLYFESFVLSQSIAAGCDEKGIGLAEEWSVFGYFAEEPTCTEVWDDSKHEGYCYWQGSIQMFLS